MPVRLRSLARAATILSLALAALAACADGEPQAPPSPATPALATDGGPRLPPAPFACPVPGTRVTRSSGATLTYQEGGTADTCLASGTDADWTGLYDLWSTRSPSAAAARTALAGLWPLRVGQSVSFDLAPAGKGGSLRWRETITVTGTAKVTVPVGRFDTYVIEDTRRGTAPGQTYAETWVSWYAPAEHLVVKREKRHLDGEETPFTPWEVVSLRRS